MWQGRWRTGTWVHVIPAANGGGGACSCVTNGTTVWIGTAWWCNLRACRYCVWWQKKECMFYECVYQYINIKLSICMATWGPISTHKELLNSEKTPMKESRNCLSKSVLCNQKHHPSMLFQHYRQCLFSIPGKTQPPLAAKVHIIFSLCVHNWQSLSSWNAPSVLSIKCSILR